MRNWKLEIETNKNCSRICTHDLLIVRFVLHHCASTKTTQERDFTIRFGFILISQYFMGFKLFMITKKYNFPRKWA